jgi:tetratricopeptide (TPR) repeat protein/SAM-dependent methyltransferase
MKRQTYQQKSVSSARLRKDSTKFRVRQPTQNSINQLISCINEGNLHDAEKLAKTITNHYPNHFFGWQSLGIIFGRTGRIDDAVACLEKAIALDPKNPTTHNSLGVFLRDCGRLSEAIQRYEKAISLQPRHSEAHNNLGNVYRDCGRFHEAERSFRTALQLNPDFAQAHSNLGNVLVDMDRAGEAETCYRNAIRLSPAYANAHNNLGNALCLLGRLDEAESAYLEAIKLNPRHINAFNNLGNALRELDRYQEAISAFNHALVIDPSFAQAHNNLGNVLHDLGRFNEAVQAYDNAIHLKPDYAEAHNNLGNSLRELGNKEMAIQSYSESIRLKPDYAEAYSNLGGSLKDIGRYEEAEHHFKEALRLKPELSEAHSNLGWLLLEKSDIHSALQSSLTAFKLKPTSSSRRLIVQCLSLTQIDQFDLALATLAVQALEETWGRPAQIVFFSQGLLLREPNFLRICERTLVSAEPVDLHAFLNLFLNDPLFNRLFQLTLTSAPLSSIPFEQFLTKLRRQMLIEAASEESLKDQMAGVSSLLSVMAQQCYINEYVYACSGEEVKIVTEIQAKISDRLEQSDTIPEILILLVACYESLSAIPFHEGLLASPFSEAVKSVLAQQIREPKIEQALRSAIPRITSIEDDVSLAVQSQYEENPYPRWVHLPRVWEPKPINQRIRDLFPHCDFTPLAPDLCPTVLIAGCGTGQQPIEVAFLLKNSDVLAVDLSIASLTYAKRKALELCVNNISFAQADILKLGELKRKFDVIESGGVLHHMRDPFEAWDVLLSLLKPNGLIKIGLYSANARRHVVELREMISAAGLGKSRSDIATFRQLCLESSNSKDFGWTIRTPDFFSTSGCRDLLFHVYEHRMTLPTIQQYLQKRELKFLGFEIDYSIIMAYRNKFPDDVAATSLSNWNMFEAMYPDTFHGMYQFWVQKF